MTDRGAVGPSAPWARVTLVLLLVLLLGGSFTLDRISGSLPAIDLRWIGLAAAAVPFALWGPGRPTVRGTPVLVVSWWLAWATWLGISALWAPSHARLADNLTGLVVLAATVLMAGRIVQRDQDPRLLELLWWFFFTVGWLYLLAALAAGPGAQGRYAAFGGGPNVFVRVMVFALVSAVALWLSGRRWAIAALPAFLLGAVLSGSRGGLLGLFVVGLVLAVPMLRRLPARIVWGSLLTTVVAAVVVVTTVPSLRGFVQARFVDQTLEQRYGSGRGQIYVDVLHIATGHPVVGAGLDSYYALIGRFQEFQYPHNLVLATVADGGVVGLVLLVAAVVSMTRAVRRDQEGRIVSPLLLAAGWFVLIASMFSGTYYDSRFAWLFLVLAMVAPAPSTAPTRGRGARRDVTWWSETLPEGPAPQPRPT